MQAPKILLSTIILCISLPIAQVNAGLIDWLSSMGTGLFVLSGRGNVDKSYQDLNKILDPQPSSSSTLSLQQQKDMNKLLGNDTLTKTEPYSQKNIYDPNDPFGNKAHDKASQQQNSVQNNQPSKLPDVTPQQQTRTLVSCGDGSSAICYREADGRISRSDQGSTFQPPQKQTNTAPIIQPSKQPDTPQQRPDRGVTPGPSIQPTLPQPQQTRTLYPCGDGSSAACYRTENGTIIRTNQSNTSRTSSLASNRWTLADARRSMPAAAATPQSRRVPDNWAYQQIKAIAEGRQPARAQQLPTASYRGVAPRYTVGGISLSKAAAERMALNVDIEGVALRGGQFILAGSRNNTTRLDAALFLTALRTACSSRDPYFSLDPPNGAAWSEQGSMASKVVWNRVQNELNKDIGGGFEIQSFSVKQRYPALWAELAPEFPELRSRLVFQPEWLRETRFGEILYKADVLLKELTTGVSLVKPGVPLRANKIAGYVPAGERRAIRDFLTNEAQRTPEGMRGHRLWFDLMPDASANATTPQHVADLRLNQYKLPGLYPILERRGLIGGRAPSPIQNAAFSSDGDIVDLSRIYPKMFVRRHDHASGKDVMDVDVEYERASNDVNERSALYANAYQELRDLADIFRAYVASVKIAKESPKVCGVASIPLTEGEKVSAPLPEFHPTEIVLTAAQYAWRDSRARHWQLITGSTISGGISLRGKEFFAAARADRSTSVTVAMKQDLADGIPAPSWDSTSGRRYMAFNIDPREPPRRVPITAENSTK